MQHITVAHPFHRRIVQVCHLAQIGRLLRRRWTRRRCLRPGDAALMPPLAVLAAGSPSELPSFIRKSPLALKYLSLLGTIDWGGFPQRARSRTWPGPDPQSPLPYVIALLIRIDQRLQSMGELVDLLRQQPELVWLAGFAPSHGRKALLAQCGRGTNRRQLQPDAAQPAPHLAPIPA